MLRDKILSAKLKVAPVEVPEWGDGPFFVKSITGADFAKVRQITSKMPEDVAKIVTDIWIALLSLCDQNGIRVLQDTDYDQFSQQPVTVITNVVRAALAVNAMDEAGHADAKND